ncbi:MAG: DUF4388 domain-containing protein [Candidatus Melainabacteria bacterium]|nr:DUF4388 domain-containing protein [Candidatus Melainabacteria bacterium]
MFSSQHNIPKHHIRINARPDAEEIQTILTKAQKSPGVKNCFTWTEEQSKQPYSITIHCPDKPGMEPEWWMHGGPNGTESMLWYYRTNDFAVVFKQMNQTLGVSNDPNDTTGKLFGQALSDHLKPISTGYIAPGMTQPKPTEDGQSGRPPLVKLLSGSLAYRPLSSHLQTASQEAATGKLAIESMFGMGSVFFSQGVPIHATTDLQQGLEALLHMFTWQDGKVSFTPSSRAEVNSINMPVQQILYRGAELIESIGFLQDYEISEQSVLKRANSNLSEKEFERIILEGPPLGLDLQKRFYQCIDGSKALRDIAGSLALSDTQWISVVCNMIKLGLIQSPNGKTFTPPQFAPPSNNQVITGNMTIPQNMNKAMQSQTQDNMRFGIPPHMMDTSSMNTTMDKTADIPRNNQGFSSGPNPPISPFGGTASGTGTFSAMFPSGGHSPAVEAFMSSSTQSHQKLSALHVGIQNSEVKFEQNKAQAVQSALLNPQSRIMSQEAFLYFLEKEFQRAFHFGSIFSLVVFSIKPPPQKENAAQTMKAVNMTIGAIGRIKSEVDILGHFGDKGYAIIMPNSDSHAAAVLVDKIVTNLTKFSPELSQYRPVLHFGTASVPKDSKTIQGLMNCAQQAMIEASKRGITRLTYGE